MYTQLLDYCDLRFPRILLPPIPSYWAAAHSQTSRNHRKINAPYNSRTWFIRIFLMITITVSDGLHRK